MRPTSSSCASKTKRFVAACLLAFGTTWSSLTSADVFREYCQFSFCYVGLNSEDAIAMGSTPPGLPWYYRSMTLLRNVDPISYCQSQFGQWGYVFSHHTTETYTQDVQGFPFTWFRIRCISSAPTVETWLFEFAIAAQCPLGWTAYNGFNDALSPYSFAYPYNFGTSQDPDVARWCQKQCGLDESMGNSGVCEKRTNLGAPPQSACAGNPINAAVGNKYQYEVDLQAAGGPFRFGRHYNSWDGRNLYENSVRSMGRSWLHDFDRVINVVRYATFERALAYRADGRTLTFIAPRGANSFAPEQSLSTMRLERLPDGLGGYTWILRGTESNEIEIYLADGRLSTL